MKYGWIALATALLGCAVPSADAVSEADVALTAPSRPAYLALGDSVAFGYDLPYIRVEDLNPGTGAWQGDDVGAMG